MDFRVFLSLKPALRALRGPDDAVTKQLTNQYIGNAQCDGQCLTNAITQIGAFSEMHCLCDMGFTWNVENEMLPDEKQAGVCFEFDEVLGSPEDGYCITPGPVECNKWDPVRKVCQDTGFGEGLGDEVGTFDAKFIVSQAAQQDGTSESGVRVQGENG